MMRCPERAMGCNSIIEFTSKVMQFCDVYNFLCGKGAQNTPESLCQHCFPRPRRTVHKQVMMPGSGNNERSFCGKLAMDIFKLYRLLLFCVLRMSNMLKSRHFAFSKTAH